MKASCHGVSIDPIILTFVIAFVSVAWMAIGLILANNNIILTIIFLATSPLPLFIWLQTCKYNLKQQKVKSDV